MSSRASVILSEGGVHAAVLCGRGRRWTVRGLATVPSTLHADTDLTVCVQPIAHALQAIEGLSLPTQLVVPSTWCYHRHLEVPGRRLTPAAAGYALEEHLPVALEELTCGFGKAIDGTALSVAMRTKPVAALLEGLLSFGVSVEWIVPDALVAVEATGQRQRPSGVAVLADKRWSLVQRSADGRVSLLRHGLGDSRPESNGLAAAMGDSETSWTVFGLRHHKEGESRPHLDDSIEVLEGAAAVEALHQRAAAAGRSVPDLCRGALGRWDAAGQLSRHLARVLALVTVLLCVFAVGLWLRASDLRQANHALRQRQVEVYRSVLPEATMAPNPALRLASERIRLERLTRTSGLSQDEPQLSQDRYCVLEDLREFVAGLPEDGRILLLDWNAERSQLSLRGRTTHHRDAERIAECVGRLPGWECRPPRTSRLDAGGVEFTVRAVRESDDHD